jgi:hypothetical protein
VSGTAFVRARGYCNLFVTTGTSTGLYLWGGAGPTPLQPGFSETTVLQLPSGVPSGLYQLPFTTENTFAVTAGTAATAVLSVLKVSGASTSDNCIGTVTVEVFTGTLP